MSVIQRFVIAVAGLLLLLTGVACGSVRATGTSAASLPSQQAAATVWGKVPYCNCFGDAMTVNVANALREAKLTVNLQEQSPRDGWLYFVVTFDPAAATPAQIGDAIAAGGGEMIDGPP